jgi:prepilin-type N-terminal cleavage/methylation domain-containing protein
LKRKIEIVYHILQNQRGLTLIEMLLAVAIFLAVVIPLSSIYLSGVSLYQNTQNRTALRNEADFVISDIMNQIQNASYFELADEPTTEDDKARKDDLINIFTNTQAGEKVLKIENETDKRNVQNELIMYTQRVEYKEKEGENIPSTTSTLTRNIYGFDKEEPNTHNIYRSFNYDQNKYIVDGLFEVDENKKNLIVYLVIAPKGEHPVFKNNQQVEFRDVEDIAKEVKRLGSAKQNEYIHIIRTEIAVNNLRKG